MAREVTYEEMVEILVKLNKDGLVHTLNIQNSICNCCNDCCAIFQAQDLGGTRTFVPSPFLVQLVDEESCDACNKCADRCPVDSIEVDEANESVFLDHDTCIGCGVCVAVCKPNSLAMERRAAAA
jgi:Pyruvate/2-oxoacid:ferredoxin oxidoreductase delta subunit